MATAGISKGGQVFFGSLCAGTFGLGCWQLQRLVEKIDKVEERSVELELPPATENWENPEQPYRRRLLRGTLRHDKEVLLGPRGAPAGVSLPRQGLSARGGSNNQSSGMAPGPQGFHVLTPLEVKNTDGQKRNVWVNRGWVPKTMVPGDKSRKDDTQASSWNRPAGTIDITAVLSSPEKPRVITLEHDYSKRPLQLFWLDGLALQAIAESEAETTLFTEIKEDGDETYPLKPPLTSMADFKTSPAIHAGYATTWFGLSAAGVYMTRKLITRGRA